jgi:hypothetical protein
MTRRTATRTALVTLGLLTLAACVVNLSFSMDKANVALKSNPGQTTLTQQAIPVNLGDYKEITDHQANIKSLDLDYLEITVTAVDTATNTASTVSGTVTLRKTLSDPPANDIAVGTLTAFPIVLNSKVRINGTPVLDAFLLAQLKSAGSFYVIVTGSIDHGVADVTVDLNLHASMGYDAGLF